MKLEYPVELKSERLILRQWTEKDYSAFAEINASSKVMEHFPSTLNERESNEFAFKLKDLISRRGWGLWVIEEKPSGAFVGYCGLHEVPPVLSFYPAVEIGWRLSDRVWGKGYATESAQMVLNFAFSQLSLDEIVSFTSTTNHKSQNVMKRIDMQNTNNNFLHPKVAEGSPLQEHVFYKITKQQWFALGTVKGVCKHAKIYRTCQQADGVNNE